MSYIDLALTSQPNLVMESALYFSLHQNCHHQLIFALINLKVFYPPPYEYEIWHYQRANIDIIQRAIEQFSREKSFRNLIKLILYKYYPILYTNTIYNKTIKNIFSNFLSTTWINNNIMELIQEKSNIYESYILNSKNPYIFHKVK